MLNMVALLRRRDVFGAVCQASANFLAGVEDVFWVKYILDLREELRDLRAVHFRKIWRADEAVVVLRRN